MGEPRFPQKINIYTYSQTHLDIIMCCITYNNIMTDADLYQYNINMSDMFPSGETEEYTPKIESHYKVIYNDNIIFIPFKNLLLNRKIEKILQHIRNVTHSNQYDKKIKKDVVMKLGGSLSGLFIKFVQGKPIKPTTVTVEYVVNPPSPIDPTRLSVMGTESPYPIQLRNNDYVYSPSNNYEEIALSIYFGYKYIPSIKGV